MSKEMILFFSAIICTSKTTEVVVENVSYDLELIPNKSVELTDKISNRYESQSLILDNTESLVKEDCGIKDIFNNMKNMSGMQYVGLISFIIVVGCLILLIIKIGWNCKGTIKSFFDWISCRKYRLPALAPHISNVELDFNNRTQELLPPYQSQSPNAPTTHVNYSSASNYQNVQVRTPQYNVSTIQVPTTQSAYNPNHEYTTIPQPLYSNMPLSHLSIPFDSASELSASEFVRAESFNMSKRKNPRYINLERSSDVRVSKQSIPPT